MASNTSVTIDTGGLLGMVLAVFLSWTTNHSIGWAIIHGLFNWLYVFYWLIFKWDGS